MCLAQGPQRSDTGEARTRDLSVSSQALYHCAPNLIIVYGRTRRLRPFRIDQTVSMRQLNCIFIFPVMSNNKAMIEYPGRPFVDQVSSYSLHYYFKMLEHYYLSVASHQIWSIGTTSANSAKIRGIRPRMYMVMRVITRC